MKTATKIQYFFMFITFIIVINACSDNTEDTFLLDDKEELVDNEDKTSQGNSAILQSDSEALLFMLEEEKLARDTYSFLYEKWGLNQFANIKKSEQSHIDAIENLLKQYNVSYTILSEGIFNDTELQSLYNTFKIDGAKSEIDALKIGATIEDLDIKDLENYVSQTSNNTLINVYQNLICGSKNHLRSFMKGLERKGGTYTPQFITQEAFNSIVNSSNEQCK